MPNLYKSLTSWGSPSPDSLMINAGYRNAEGAIKNLWGDSRSINAGKAAVPAEGGGFMEDFMGDLSWSELAMGAGKLGIDAYLGMKQYGLARDQLDFSKEAFERNFNANRTLTNANLRDRQRARVASNPGAYQSVGTYMDQNRVR